MRRYFIYLILTPIFIAGCGITSFVSINPQIDDPNIVYTGDKPESKHLIYIWLPPAFKSQFLPYVNAFDSDVESYCEQNNISNFHDQAQELFNQKSMSVGGLFNEQFGQLQNNNLNRAVKLTVEELSSKHGSDVVVVFLSPHEEIIEVVDGHATWHNTYQKSFIPSDESKATRYAVNLTINYYSLPLTFQRFTVGLDMEGKEKINKEKYKNIVKHIFAPLF